MLIEYKVKGGTCLTDCPNGEKELMFDSVNKVGSIFCKTCKYFGKKIKMPSGQLIVDCKYGNKEGV